MYLPVSTVAVRDKTKQNKSDDPHSEGESNHEKMSDQGGRRKDTSGVSIIPEQLSCCLLVVVQSNYQSHGPTPAADKKDDS